MQSVVIRHLSFVYISLDYRLDCPQTNPTTGQILSGTHDTELPEQTDELNVFMEMKDDGTPLGSFRFFSPLFGYLQDDS